MEATCQSPGSFLHRRTVHHLRAIHGIRDLQALLPARLVFFEMILQRDGRLALAADGPGRKELLIGFAVLPEPGDIVQRDERQIVLEIRGDDELVALVAIERDQLLGDLHRGEMGAGEGHVVLRPLLGRGRHGRQDRERNG